MLKGAGLHQNFGWKPIGKYSFAGANSYDIDITGLLDTLTVLKILISGLSVGHLHLRLDDDVGNNYSYSTHDHGYDGLANVHAQAAVINTAQILVAENGHKFSGELTFQYNTNVLGVRGEILQYIAADAFTLRSLIGSYNSDVPYVEIKFLDSGAANFTMQIQLFKGVYSF